MNAKQFNNALEQLELSRSSLARIIGVDESTVRRWGKPGRGDVPIAVAMLLLVAGEYGVTLPDLQEFSSAAIDGAGNPARKKASR